MEHHRREGNAQCDRRLPAVQDAGVAMPAFLWIPHQGRGSLFPDSEDIGGTNLRAGPASVTLLFHNDGWHGNLLLHIPTGWNQIEFAIKSGVLNGALAEFYSK